MIQGQSFANEIAAARGRLDAIRQRAGESAQQRLEAAVGELSTTLDELRVADDELREQNEQLTAERSKTEAIARQYHDLFEMTPAGYVITDPNGTIREANLAAAELLGRARELLAGKPLAAAVRDTHQREFSWALARCVARGETLEFESELVSPPGARARLVRLTVAPTITDGRAGALRWLIQDLTAQRENEGEIRRLNDAVWARVAERTAMLTSERDALREMVGKLEARVAAMERAHAGNG